jgi:hypothetical protein
MKKLIFVLLSAFIFLGGCINPKYNYRPQTTEISKPPLDIVVTVNIGDSMLHQGEYSEHDAIYLKQDVKASGLATAYTFTSGYYFKKGEDDKSEYYLPSNEPDSGRVIESMLIDPFKIIRLDKKSGKLCGVTIYNFEECTSNADYEKKKYPLISSDSFQQTLIYNGKVKDKITIGYREFSNNVARPAFNNNVEYDLSESNIIGYKGARIEVVEATNEYIKYRVLNNFNWAQY